MDHLLSIKTFVSVVRLKSFSKAAVNLKMSTAAVSRAITNLEAHTQTRLINRTSRYVALSDLATEYYAACCEVLERIQESESQLTQGQQSKGGLLRVLVHPFAVEVGLPQLLETFRHDAADVNMVVTVDTGFVKLEHGDYDVAVYPRNEIEGVNVICRPLVSSPFILVAGVEYWVKACQKLKVPDLSGHMLIACSDQKGRQDGLKLSKDGTITGSGKPSVTLVVGESTAIRLALRGYGLALLPHVVAEPYIASGRLRVVFPDYQIVRAHAELDVAFVRAQPLPRRTRDFVDACIRYFRAIDARQLLQAENYKAKTKGGK